MSAQAKHAEDEPGEGPFYIPATAIPAYRPRTLKAGDTFLVLDLLGDASGTAPSSEGLFHRDTRFLSRLLLTIDGHRPLLLSSTISEDNVVFAVDLTNPDVYAGRRLALPREHVHLLRSKVLAEGAMHERMTIRNFAQHEVELGVTIEVAADFADIFEVRGQTRPRRGRLMPDMITEDGLLIAYEGLDGTVRRTRIRATPAPATRAPGRIGWRLTLPTGGTAQIEIAVECEAGTGDAAPRVSYEAALATATRKMAARRREAAHLTASREPFNSLLGRSRADLDMLMSQTPHGLYAYAGIPWFSVPFGRDGIITALQCLWLDPLLARGTLEFLAATQATELSPAQDAEPGKILHETRKGEMAALGEVPFGAYYGSVDSTPLFLMLAAAYARRTGDYELIRRIWPNIRSAIGWMEKYGDVDNDGFLEYDRKSVNGLINQGWKDSSDSVFHADGRLADAPIALCEVQAYAYAAWLGAAELAAAVGHGELERRWFDKAETLQRRFEQVFWCEEIGTYALALDGEKKPCRVRSSNAGHALISGIASNERAARVAASLMEPTSFTGWGIRTIAEGEARYNPMSYHNGSIWPHDNGMIAMGMARYDLKAPLQPLLTGLFEASRFMEHYRLPELFCGFPRRPGQGPTAYPVACLPQAWAAASVFAVLGAMLGVSFDPAARLICFTRPAMPAWLDELRVEELRLCDASVDLLFRRHVSDVSVNVLKKEGQVDVILVA
jgi:glycogen debranching enzyme